jgi:hypothetical protein
LYRGETGKPDAYFYKNEKRIPNSSYSSSLNKLLCNLCELIKKITWPVRKGKKCFSSFFSSILLCCEVRNDCYFLINGSTLFFCLYQQFIHYFLRRFGRKGKMLIELAAIKIIVG